MAPLLIEIVGAAGAGKTTLLAALQKSGQPIEAIFSFRRPAHAFSFGRALLSVLPFLIGQRVRGRSYSKKVMVWMIRLAASYAILQRQASRQQQKVIILDQGPVYMLTRLAEYGAGQGRDEHFDGWWRQSLSAWAALLDLVILLDAPEAVLVQRVFDRTKEHFAKGKSEVEAKAVLALHRKLYRQVVEQLTDSNKTRLLHFDTSRHSVHQLLVEIGAILKQSGDAHAGVFPSVEAMTTSVNL